MKYFITLIALFLITTSQAQEKIKVVYSSQMKMDIDNLKLSGNHKTTDEHKKAMLEAFQEVHYFELITSPTAYSYKKIEKINNDLPKEDGVSISISAGDSFSYTDLLKQKTISKKVNFNESYLVKSDLEKFDWKITREKMTYLNYEVRKATHKDSTQLITAWYAPKINIKSGPSEFWGLPGLILKVEVEKLNKKKTKYYFNAQEIEILDNNTVLEKPTGGVEVTQQEFKEILEKQRNKFKEMYADGVDTSD